MIFSIQLLFFPVFPFFFYQWFRSWLITQESSQMSPSLRHAHLMQIMSWVLWAESMNDGRRNMFGALGEEEEEEPLPVSKPASPYLGDSE